VQATPEFLARVSLFEGLPQHALEEILAAGIEKSYVEESFLFYQDDPAERMYILLSGRVKLTQLSDDGQQVIMRVITPGLMFAAIGIVQGAKYPVTAQAAADSVALYWNQDALLKLIEHYPVLALRALRLMSTQVREFQDRYRELATERVERRLARAILRLATQTGRKTEGGVLLDLTISRQDLAEMSGTTLFTVSRILSQWEGQGLVQTGRERILIRFPHGLVSIAEDLPQRGRPGATEETP
jgi:CRP-like cAMP-binding protein